MKVTLNLDDQQLKTLKSFLGSDRLTEKDVQKIVKNIIEILLSAQRNGALLKNGAPLRNGALWNRKSRSLNGMCVCEVYCPNCGSRHSAPVPLGLGSGSLLNFEPLNKVRASEWS